MSVKFNVVRDSELSDVKSIGRGICGASFVTWRGKRYVRKPAELSYLQNEVASYELAHAMGFDFTPETILCRDDNYEFFTLQIFIDDTRDFWRAENDIRANLLRLHDKFAVIFLYDFLLQNSDRHGSNLLIKKSDNEPVCIDHHLTFTTWEPCFVPYTCYDDYMNGRFHIGAFASRLNRAELNQVFISLANSKKIAGLKHRINMLGRCAFMTVSEFRNNMDKQW